MPRATTGSSSVNCSTPPAEHAGMVEDHTISDATLLERCLAGDELAWRQLIYRHRRLIYSIPIRFRLSPETAADVFQEVCLKLLRNLDSIRPDHLRGWLCTVTRHESIRRKQSEARGSSADELESLFTLASDEDFVWQMEQEQAIRDAVAQLPPRCQSLIQMLFYDRSAPSYSRVAERLGVAKNSIGFLRSRCLQKLARELRKIGFGK